MRKNILQSDAFLYATEFFAGMSVMAVELGASRLLAPYFSSSQIIWTIIIGTIMIATALGNLWGGRQADRDPDPARLYRRLIIAALWIAAVPFLGKYVILAIGGALAMALDANLLAWAAFLSCLALFAFPLFLLGSVTPCLVKYCTANLSHNARVVGRLGAFQTVGSILGTFLPTFVTIPAWGTAVSFLVFAGVLLALGLAYFLRVGTSRLFLAAPLFFLALCVLGTQSGVAFWAKGLLYEGESVYNYLQVRETERATIFSTNALFGVQSVLPKKDGLTGLYYDYALAAPALAADDAPPEILVLGMGTGTFARQCRRYFPRCRLTGVEIDEKITALARRYFDLAGDIPVAADDGRAWLRADRRRYGVIFVDAYQDITIPFQMSSVEFFRLVRDHLAPGGVMAVNFNMRTEEAAGINACLAATIGAVFPAMRIVDAGGTNRVLFAAMDEGFPARLTGTAGAVADPALAQRLREIARDWETPPPGGQVLTDDRAPVELLGMRALDATIRKEADYYRKILREEGIRGLLDAM